jgi:hypothetical protein
VNRRGRPQPGQPDLEVSAICVPKPGEIACGDGWAIHESSGRTLLAVVDGLGHGPDAAIAARAALDTFAREAGRAAPAEIVRQAHGALKSTRGAAVAVLQLDARARQIRIASVGNVIGAVVDGDASRRMLSQNGTVGHALPRVTEVPYPWPPGALVAVHTDGLATRWDIGKYAGLTARDCAVVGGVLFRDHARGSDDATVVCLRERNR